MNKWNSSRNGRNGSPLSVPCLLHPAQPPENPVKSKKISAKSCWTGAALFSHRGTQPLFSPYLRHLVFTYWCFQVHVLSFQSGTLERKMALSQSHLVPARKPSACQVPARYCRTSQSAREVLLFHSQSQICHLIINCPDRVRQGTTMKEKIIVLPHTTCTPEGGQEEVRG